MEHRLHLDRLSGTERLVLLLYYAGEDGTTSDAQIAADFAELFPLEAWKRDRVNTIRRSAERKLRRQAGLLVDAA